MLKIEQKTPRTDRHFHPSNSICPQINQNKILLFNSFKNKNKNPSNKPNKDLTMITKTLKKETEDDYMMEGYLTKN